MLRRGQTLIIFTFMLLFLSLMVMLTVSFGLRVRERMELQTLADASAYSSAVATARVFNTVAIAHRTEWALLVAQSATQAYISWTSIYRDALMALRDDAGTFIGGYITLVCPIPQKPPAGIALTQYLQKLNQEINRVNNVWDAVDKAASAQVRNYNIIESTFYISDFQADYHGLAALLQNQGVAQAVIAKAGGSPWPVTAPAAADAVTMRETAADCSQGAWCDGMIGGTSIHQYEIYMGSRGDSFTTGRNGGNAMMTAKLMQIVSGYGVAAYTGGKGASYRSDQFDGPRHGQFANWGAAHSDDEGNVVFFGQFGGCPIPVPPLSVDANVLANLQSNPDAHTWSRGTCANQGDISHSLIGNIAGGNWPITFDYTESKVQNALDLFGQPKHFALLQRDYGGGVPGALKPVFLDFDFAFVPGSPKHFSNRGTRSEGMRLDSNLKAVSDGGAIDMAKQTALATGLAYYHRGGQWEEPPNMMNPFWRATLVAPDIDAQGKMPGGDIPQTMQQGGVPWAGDAAKALYNAGFRGFQ